MERDSGVRGGRWYGVVECGEVEWKKRSSVLYRAQTEKTIFSALSDSRKIKIPKKFKDTVDRHAAVGVRARVQRRTDKPLLLLLRPTQDAVRC